MTEFPARNLRILFVCTANICRSAMAQSLMRREVANRGLRVDVRSAGTRALDGDRATFEAKLVMSKIGAPTDDHVAVTIAPFVADWADLILGMTKGHVSRVRRSFPSVAGRAFTLHGLVDALPALPSIADLDDWLRQATSAVEGSPDRDIADPIGRSVEVYERVAHEIADAVSQLAGELERRGLGPTTSA